MNPFYNQDYSSEKINNVLKIIKKCIKDNNYSITLNEKRQENIDFIKSYNIRSAKQKAILMELSAYDFRHTLHNTKPGFEYEVLFVFAPRVNLYNAEGKEEAIDVYIKINIIETSDNKCVAIISFHRLNKPIEYLFR